PGRQRRLLRVPRRQELPSRDLLHEVRRREAPVTGDVHGEVTVDRLTLSDEIVRRTGDATTDVAEYALWLGDDALVLAHQLGWWISRAPELEEDIALGNIALDLLGHARSLLSYAGSATGRTEDDLAYWRGERAFRSSQL